VSAPQRRALGLGLGLGALVGLVYLALGFHYRPGGGVAVHLRDAYIFYQYAAGFAQGHPYAFMPGDAPSTGSTSHLYPLLLALFHVLGATGDALSVAGAFASLASYLSSIGLLWLIARRLAPQALPLVMLLCAASGHLAISIFDQTDAVLSVPLALAAFAALLHRRTAALRVALVLLSLTRPDGFIVSIALLAATLLGPSTPGTRRSHTVSACLGILAFGATLLLNQLLTGTWTPQSVLAKGLFHDYSAVGALHLASRAAGGLFVELVLGIGNDTRQMFLLPLVGAALALCGFAARSREGEIFERFYPIAALLTLAAGILTGTSGIHRDRYLAWALPIVLVYAGAGVPVVARWCRAPGLVMPLSVLLVGYQLLGTVFMASAFAHGSARTASNVRFVKQTLAHLPDGARVGLASGSGLAYFLPGRHVTHVNGMVSPAFSHPHPNVVGAEILEHRPELRFDHWLVRPAALRSAWYRPFVGRLVAAEPQEVSGGDALALFEADWSTLEASTSPDPPAELDVGYPPSEDAHAYHQWSRLPGAQIEPTLVTGRLEDRRVSDVGRVVRGSESFEISRPTSDALTLVLRTAWRADARVRSAMNVHVQRFHTPSPLELTIRVDDEIAAEPSLPLRTDADLIQEFEIQVPVRESRSATLRIDVEGDYLSLGYRFREPQAPRPR
jgi:hypothetical protein